MQVSATLIAAQQAAREAQARFQANHVAPSKPGGADFAVALGEQGFAPLPLKQTASPAAAAPAPDAAPASRLGSLLDIKV
jgi:hypothetical protein